MNFLEAPLVVGIICYFVYMIFELFACRKERLSLIEKIGQNIAEVDLSMFKNRIGSLLPAFPKKSFTSLRIGSLMAGLGLGLLVGFLIELSVNCNVYTETHFRNVPVAYGSSVLLFGGAGLIISHIIEKKERKKEEPAD